VTALRRPNDPVANGSGSSAAGRGLNGVEGNARLTATTGVVVVVLLAAEGVTVLRVGPLLTLHVFIGMLLVPPILLKMGSTAWRFAKYYGGSPEYRAKGPPPIALRFLGPLVIVLTVVLFASGVLLLLGPTAWRSQMLLLHKASFVLWLGAMALHVLGHVMDTVRLAPADFVARTRRQVQGAGIRQWLLALSVVVGVGLGVLVVPYAGPWLTSGHPG
jgi:hypothetical protein